MKLPETPDPLDALLRDNENYLADDGFTARVVAALPPRRRRAPWRQVILLSVILGSLAIAFWWLPPLTGIFTVTSNGTVFVDISQQSLATVAVFVVGIGSLFWSLFAALQWED